MVPVCQCSSTRPVQSQKGNCLSGASAAGSYGRAQTTASKRGYDITGLRARAVSEKDFDQFDLILAMDWDNLGLLQQMAPKRTHHKLQLLMRFATEHESATIPDPYYGNQQGFEQTLDLIEDACAGLLEVARRRATQVAAA